MTNAPNETLTELRIPELLSYEPRPGTGFQIERLDPATLDEMVRQFDALAEVFKNFLLSKHTEATKNESGRMSPNEYVALEKKLHKHLSRISTMKETVHREKHNLDMMYLDINALIAEAVSVKKDLELVYNNVLRAGAGMDYDPSSSIRAQELAELGRLQLQYRSKYKALNRRIKALEREQQRFQTMYNDAAAGVLYFPDAEKRLKPITMAQFGFDNWRQLVYEKNPQLYAQTLETLRTNYLQRVKKELSELTPISIASLQKKSSSTVANGKGNGLRGGGRGGGDGGDGGGGDDRGGGGGGGLGPGAGSGGAASRQVPSGSEPAKPMSEDDDDQSFYDARDASVVAKKHYGDHDEEDESLASRLKRRKTASAARTKKRTAEDGAVAGTSKQSEHLAPPVFSEFVGPHPQPHATVPQTPISFMPTLPERSPVTSTPKRDRTPVPRTPVPRTPVPRTPVPPTPGRSIPDTDWHQTSMQEAMATELPPDSPPLADEFMAFAPTSPPPTPGRVEETLREMTTQPPPMLSPIRDAPNGAAAATVADVAQPMDWIAEMNASFSEVKPVQRLMEPTQFNFNLPSGGGKVVSARRRALRASRTQKPYTTGAAPATAPDMRDLVLRDEHARLIDQNKEYLRRYYAFFDQQIRNVGSRERNPFKEFQAETFLTPPIWTQSLEELTQTVPVIGFERAFIQKRSIQEIRESALIIGVQAINKVASLRDTNIDQLLRDVGKELLGKQTRLKYTLKNVYDVFYDYIENRGQAMEQFLVLNCEYGCDLMAAYTYTPYVLGVTAFLVYMPEQQVFIAVNEEFIPLYLNNHLVYVPRLTESHAPDHILPDRIAVLRENGIEVLMTPPPDEIVELNSADAKLPLPKLALPTFVLATYSAVIPPPEMVTFWNNLKLITHELDTASYWIESRSKGLVFNEYTREYIKLVQRYMQYNDTELFNIPASDIKEQIQMYLSVQLYYRRMLIDAPAEALAKIREALAFHYGILYRIMHLRGSYRRPGQEAFKQIREQATIQEVRE